MYRVFKTRDASLDIDVRVKLNVSGSIKGKIKKALAELPNIHIEKKDYHYSISEVIQENGEKGVTIYMGSDSEQSLRGLPSISLSSPHLVDSLLTLIQEAAKVNALRRVSSNFYDIDFEIKVLDSTKKEITNEQLLKMSYATTDYSSYGRSVGHGGNYEVDFIKPVDIWDWVYTTTYIYAKFEAYEKFHKELLEFEVFYNGDFDISGDSFNEGNSTIDSAYTFDKYGAAGTTFSPPISWSEIGNTNYSGNNFGTKIIGSPYDDVIYGDAGNDSIQGGSGDDVIDADFTETKD